MWSYSENIWPNAQRNWPNACVHIWSLSVGLTKCAAHLGKRAAQLAKCARVWPNAQIGQMRLTLVLVLRFCARDATALKIWRAPPLLPEPF